MNSTPYKIPRSLLPYKEQFESDPKKAIQRLERHVKKRGNDAVGHYLLSTFYYQSNQKQKAVKAAWKAKIFAAGSPSMNQLHYFMLHPERFEAWNPSAMRKGYRNNWTQKGTSAPIRDLDSLIRKLSSIEPRKPKIEELENEMDLGEASTHVEDIVTETLAEIHVKQGNLSAAIKAYEQLTKRHPEKADEFRKTITSLQKKDKN